MKVTEINYSQRNSKVRLSTQIILNSGKKHDIYFEIDKEFKDFIAKDASPFLAATLALSMKKRESLEIDGAVSKNLMTNTPKIMKILKSWNVGLSPISIQAKFLKKDLKKYEKIGCFFSGGVDSFYTYLKNKNKISYLIFVHGFDISVENLELYKKIEKNIIKIAKNQEVKLVKVKTNIRETFDQYFDWDMSHEFAIASIALFLRKGFKEIYASCGLPNKNTDHHFMRPDLEPLWSSEHMKIIHYGCNADKIIKAGFLSNYKLVMESLKVCWVNKNQAYNCCECEKCFRNMLALYVSNSLEKCKTFDKSLNLYKLKNIRISEYCLKYFIAVLEVLKRKNENSTVRFALEECIRNNQFPKLQERLKRNIRDFISFFDQKYNRNRLYWFLAQRGLI